MSTLEERRAERRRRRQMEEESVFHGRRFPEDLRNDIKERLALRRKERAERNKEREERKRAITASSPTVNGEDDLERRRRERREARLKAAGGGDTDDTYSSRRNRRRGTEEDTTEEDTYRSGRNRGYDKEEEDTSYRSHRRRGYEVQEETTSYNDTSATDTASAEAAAEAAKEEQRRRQREEEEEEARRQQEKEEAEERRRQEQAEARRREEEEDRKREQERIRRKQKADTEFEALKAEYEESGQRDEEREIQRGSSHSGAVTEKSNLDKDGNVIDMKKDGSNAKSLQRQQSNSFDKTCRRITAKINKFQQLNERTAEERERDKYTFYVLYHDKIQNNLTKFEHQDFPATTDNSGSHRLKEVDLIVKKVNEKLQKYEVKGTNSDGTKSPQPNPDKKKPVLDRWKSQREKASLSVLSPTSWNSFARRLSGNTQFVTSRFIEKVKDSGGNTQVSPTNSPRQLSHSPQSVSSPKRSVSQTSECPSDSSSKTEGFATPEIHASGSVISQERDDLNTRQAKREGHNIQQIKRKDPNTQQSLKNETPDTQDFDEEVTDSMSECSKSNSAIDSFGSSYDYDDTCMQRHRSSSDEEEARLEQQRLEEERRQEEERQKQEEEARMAAEEETKRKKKGKRKGLGGLSPEKKKKLKEISFIDYDTEEEEEKWRVVSERLMPLPDDFESLNTADLKKLCKQLHDKLAQFESELYDWEFKCENQEKEVNELTLKVNDSKGKFVKPVLRKTNKTESKFAKIKKNKQKIEDFRDQLKSTEQSKHEEEQVKSPDYRDTLKKPVELQEDN